MPRYEVWTTKVVHERHIVEAADAAAVDALEDYGPVLSTEVDYQYRNTTVEELGEEDA